MSLCRDFAALQVVNCLLTASYMLAMRGAMDRVAQHTSDGQKLGEFSMVGGAGGIGMVDMTPAVAMQLCACVA